MVVNTTKAVATPDVTAPVPICVAPSLNVTVPVGAVPVTAAVNVTDWPTSAGFSDDVTVVVVEPASAWPDNKATKTPAAKPQRRPDLRNEITARPR